MDPAYAALYRRLATDHWWWQSRNAYVRTRVARLLSGRTDARVLDVGCGDGVLFPFLSSFGHVEGVEPDPLVVTPDGPWRQHIHLRPFDTSFQPKAPFDLIVMLDVIEHLDDPAAALRHAASLLTGEGRILVTVPAFNQLWTHHDTINLHRQRFTRRSLEAVAQAADLRLCSGGYLFQWLFAAKLVERLKERLGRVTPAPGIPSSPINSLLYTICRLEQTVAGERVPFGSSFIAELQRSPPAGTKS